MPNLHVTFGVENGEAFSGHLEAATVGGWAFVTVYLADLARAEPRAS